eukprot:CAMPEP_0115037760 /NCGR_PEP_ID=MMETSP0216-20121206/43004_1 /TAXON_ID=223996 /ORGANISM="Protocruzia adherens, Strain Boccale" /LENGTH=862 /DNA_ID=CAMNT_0002418029 /DNA_START=14 /DNA_END=2604 /DNA_ORIENTATION=-
MASFSRLLPIILLLSLTVPLDAADTEDIDAVVEHQEENQNSADSNFDPSCTFISKGATIVRCKDTIFMHDSSNGKWEQTVVDGIISVGVDDDESFILVTTPRAVEVVASGIHSDGILRDAKYQPQEGGAILALGICGTMGGAILGSWYLRYHKKLILYQIINSQKEIIVMDLDVSTEEFFKFNYEPIPIENDEEVSHSIIRPTVEGDDYQVIFTVEIKQDTANKLYQVRSVLMKAPKQPSIFESSPCPWNLNAIGASRYVLYDCKTILVSDHWFLEEKNEIKCPGITNLGFSDERQTLQFREMSKGSLSIFLLKNPQSDNYLVYSLIPRIEKAAQCALLAKKIEEDPSDSDVDSDSDEIFSTNLGDLMLLDLMDSESATDFDFYDGQLRVLRNDRIESSIFCFPQHSFDPKMRKCNRCERGQYSDGGSEVSCKPCNYDSEVYISKPESHAGAYFCEKACRMPYSLSDNDTCVKPVTLTQNCGRCLQSNTAKYQENIVCNLFDDEGVVQAYAALQMNLREQGTVSNVLCRLYLRPKYSLPWECGGMANNCGSVDHYGSIGKLEPGVEDGGVCKWLMMTPADTNVLNLEILSNTTPGKIGRRLALDWYQDGVYRDYNPKLTMVLSQMDNGAVSIPLVVKTPSGYGRVEKLIMCYQNLGDTNFSLRYNYEQRMMTSPQTTLITLLFMICFLGLCIKCMEKRRQFRFNEYRRHRFPFSYSHYRDSHSGVARARDRAAIADEISQTIEIRRQLREVLYANILRMMVARGFDQLQIGEQENPEQREALVNRYLENNEEFEYGNQVDDFDQVQCCICCDDFEHESKVRKLACKHIFHSMCVEQWLKMSNRDPSCPVCNDVIKDPAVDDA